MQIIDVNRAFVYSAVVRLMGREMGSYKSFLGEPDF
jgi:hypothetical protein